MIRNDPIVSRGSVPNLLILLIATWLAFTLVLAFANVVNFSEEIKIKIFCSNVLLKNRQFEKVVDLSLQVFDNFLFHEVSELAFVQLFVYQLIKHLVILLLLINVLFLVVQLLKENVAGRLVKHVVQEILVVIRVGFNDFSHINRVRIVGNEGAWDSLCMLKNFLENLTEGNVVELTLRLHFSTVYLHFLLKVFLQAQDHRLFDFQAGNRKA